MRFKRDGHAASWICDNCGDAVATTYFEPYEIDSTIYHILLSSPFKADIDTLKLISKLSGCNYIEARKMIQNAPIEIFSGQATEVLRIQDALGKAGIKYRITPEFPYSNNNK